MESEGPAETAQRQPWRLSLATGLVGLAIGIATSTLSTDFRYRGVAGVAVLAAVFYATQYWLVADANSVTPRGDVCAPLYRMTRPGRAQPKSATSR
jgi:hypothetical protein